MWQKVVTLDSDFALPGIIICATEVPARRCPHRFCLLQVGVFVTYCLSAGGTIHFPCSLYQVIVLVNTSVFANTLALPSARMIHSMSHVQYVRMAVLPPSPLTSFPPSPPLPPPSPSHHLRLYLRNRSPKPEQIRNTAMKPMRAPMQYPTSPYEMLRWAST